MPPKKKKKRKTRAKAVSSELITKASEELEEEVNAELEAEDKPLDSIMEQYSTADATFPIGGIESV